jgi:hypothetical protein
MEILAATDSIVVGIIRKGKQKIPHILSGPAPAVNE